MTSPQNILSVALHQPKIPPNTGNIIRLCANTNTALHLIAPLGFLWNDKQLSRAGLDYHSYTRCQHHADTPSFLKAQEGRRIIACSTKASIHYHQFEFCPGDLLLFGSETEGLPIELRTPPNIHSCVKIPMASHSRSLNLANSVGIILYEALRQLHFPDLS